MRGRTVFLRNEYSATASVAKVGRVSHTIGANRLLERDQPRNNSRTTPPPSPATNRLPRLSFCLPPIPLCPPSPFPSSPPPQPPSRPLSLPTSPPIFCPTPPSHSSPPSPPPSPPFLPVLSPSLSSPLLLTPPSLPPLPFSPSLFLVLPPLFSLGSPPPPPRYPTPPPIPPLLHPFFSSCHPSPSHTTFYNLQPTYIAYDQTGNRPTNQIETQIGLASDTKNRYKYDSSTARPMIDIRKWKSTSG